MRDKASQNSYDQIPYPSLSHAQSHPDNLATIAALFGIDAPPVENCRVLEVGCAGGGNLIPMAYGLPNAEFVGIDSSGQIAQGQAITKTLELTNITLKCLDIVDVDTNFGQFDYIIAHGVYSWVVREVQDRILRICKQHLTPTGIAYISYNTYPGWAMRGALRDIMLYYTRHLADPLMRADQARDLLDFLAEATSAKNSPYYSFLRNHREELKKKTEAYLIHDELEDVNDPIYFFQFVGQAAQNGLQYLAEAEFSTMLAAQFPLEVSNTLHQISKNIIDFEQYLDFLTNRSFRQTLLCHQEIPLDRELNPERLMSLHISSLARPVSSTPKIHTDTIEQFRAPDKATLSTDHPLTKTAMVCLAEVWPQAVSFNTLLVTARSRLGLDPTPTENANSCQDTHYLATNLLRAYGYSSQLVKLYVHPFKYTCNVSERPIASAIARHQASQGNPIVTNLRHERIRLNKFSHHLLPYLDGNHDHASLIIVLEQLGIESIVETVEEKHLIQDAKLVRVKLIEELKLLAQCALLVS